MLSARTFFLVQTANDALRAFDSLFEHPGPLPPPGLASIIPQVGRAIIRPTQPDIRALPRREGRGQCQGKRGRGSATGGAVQAAKLIQVEHHCEQQRHVASCDRRDGSGRAGGHHHLR